MAAPTPPIIAL